MVRCSAGGRSSALAALQWNPGRAIVSGQVTIGRSHEEASLEAAVFWSHRAEEAIAQRGRFIVAISGGTTPRRLFELLAVSPGIDWARCHIFWADERMAPSDDVISNFRLGWDALLSRVPIHSEQMHRVPTEIGDASAVAASYQATLLGSLSLGLFDRPRFDLVLLGLGADGHIASLFPGCSSLREERRLVVSSPPGALPPPVDRVTMTLPVINSARAIAFLVTGSDKADVLSRALRGDADLPASRVGPSDGVLRWFVDEDAAGRPAERDTPGR
ncbi:MAG: 6-phosphogluconolactonase [Chloroflexi bacterium]|nr:6-phosphogluconolactonase [Chloroflexota bacterium]